MILANEMMKGGYIDENGVRRKPTTEGNALKMAKEIFNSAAMRFNKIKRENGDDFHTVPIPFDENGRLHPDYMNNHYGSHQSRRVPTAQRQTRTEDGRLINNHANNKAHPTLGVHRIGGVSHTKGSLTKLKSAALTLNWVRNRMCLNLSKSQTVSRVVIRQMKKTPHPKKTTPSHHTTLRNTNKPPLTGEYRPCQLLALWLNAHPLFNPSAKEVCPPQR